MYFSLSCKGICMCAALVSWRVWINKKKWLQLLVLLIVERHYPHTSPFVWKCITLSELDFFSFFFFFSQSSLNITYSFHASVRCRDSGSSGFLISPSVSYLFEALSEGQNQIHPNEKAIVDLFLHLVPPYSLSPRKHLSFFVLPEAYETIRAHLCPEENSPALSKAV